ncbi:MAG: multifunctional 2',3'-cyclic-nucleotide 2'-phosphodiesterase/5'-nucleotidase/3'-nucleotidase [Armatimonadia bacterium]|nr:multifunctional 2',3'-cyclic-nucleotide 2'-phosphodiesterase/5'-nucleotidase/3'-nucleotidase [Armatimonadia bacterium]
MSKDYPRAASFSGRVAGILLVGALLAVTCGAWATPQEVTILHFNDFHGNVLAPEDEGELGGLARIAGIIDQIRAENEQVGVQTLVLIAGDILQGTPLSTVFHGEADFAALNLMDISAMALGNHEFDYGMPNLHKLIDMSQFPILSANIRRKVDDTQVFDGTERFMIGDEMLVVIGLTTPETRVTTMPSNVADLTFNDAAQVAGMLADRITRTTDRVVIALTHLGHEQDLDLARDVPALDVIVGGHSHTRVDEAVMVDGTPVVQAYAYGQYLGRLDLMIDEGQVIDFDYRLIPVDASAPEDPEVTAVIVDYQRQLDDEIKRVVGRTEVPLDGAREIVRAGESNLGNAITDAMRLVSGAPIALHNGGGIRASIDAGPVTLEEVMQVLPFGNEVATLELTGAQLREILARSIAEPRPFGGFLHVSGLTIVADGQELESVMVGDDPLDDGTTYSVATNAFLMEGGDGYETFTEGKKQYYVGTKLDTAFVQYLRKHESISPEVEGRITIK